ncbi:MAG TPA: translation elongation factor Ts, partial [Planctomycetes bacterium]|nr:translation elongation factor Ts [Planctomycetota bacterium]
MSITSGMVRDLRDRTGAGMMDCKKALVETEGDLEAAEDHLRKQGLKSAEKKAGRDTGEGRVFSVIGESGHVGSMVSISCETDFVAKTPDFQQFLQDLCDHVAANDPTDVDAFHAQAWQGGDQTGEGAVKTLIGKLGENMKVAQISRYENAAGCVGSYVHHDGKLDNIPAMLSPGEYVVNAASVRKYGAGFFGALNANSRGPVGTDSGLPGLGFGSFISKAFKSVTKVIKKVAGFVVDTVQGTVQGLMSGDPLAIASVVGSFILPGITTALTSAMSAASAATA